MSEQDGRPWVYDERTCRRRPVAVCGSDITGRKLVEFSDGRREWVGPYGVYAGENSDQVWRPRP